MVTLDADRKWLQPDNRISNIPPVWLERWKIRASDKGGVQWPYSTSTSSLSLASLPPPSVLVLQNGFHSLQDREKILIADGEKRGAIPFPRAHSACYSRARGSSLLQTFAHNKTNGTQTFEREWIIRRNYIELSSLYFLFLSFRCLASTMGWCIVIEGSFVVRQLSRVIFFLF